MKKKFVEPEIVRIDLKMTENIAGSEGYGEDELIGMGSLRVYTRQFVDGCNTFYVGTEIRPSSHPYTDPNELVMQLAMGRCFTNPAEQARAFMLYGR